MSRSKYLSLSETRKKQLDRLAKEHPSAGDADQLLSVIERMSKTPESAEQISPKESNSEGCT
jgi:hypothetical protein